MPGSRATATSEADEGPAPRQLTFQRGKAGHKQITERTNKEIPGSVNRA